MSAATVTSKGQITIPADVRRTLHIAAGDRVEFVETGPGRFEMVAATGSVRDLKGVAGPRERAVSLEEMDEAIAAGASGSNAGASTGSPDTDGCRVENGTSIVSHRPGSNSGKSARCTMRGRARSSSSTR